MATGIDLPLTFHQKVGNYILPSSLPTFHILLLCWFPGIKLQTYTAYAGLEIPVDSAVALRT